MAQVTVTSSATTLDAAASTRAVIVDNRGPAPITLSTGVVVLPFKSRQVSVTSGTPLTATCGTGLTSIVNVDDQPVSSGGGGGGGGSTVTVDSTGQIVVNGTATNLATDAEVEAVHTGNRELNPRLGKVVQRAHLAAPAHAKAP